MGVLAGYEQKQIYVEDGLWPLVNVLASKLNIPIYKLVNDALKNFVETQLTPEERKMLRVMLKRSKRRGSESARRTSGRKARDTDRRTESIRRERTTTDG